MALPAASMSCPMPRMVLHALKASAATTSSNAVARIGLPEAPNVDEVPGDRSGRRHRGAHQMRPAAGPLTAFEVAVGGRRTAVAGRKLVVVHAEAHRAARLAPLETGFGEHLVE